MSNTARAGANPTHRFVSSTCGTAKARPFSLVRRSLTAEAVTHIPSTSRTPTAPSRSFRTSGPSPLPATRFARAKAALQLAAEDPPVIDTAEAEDWLPQHLDDQSPGSALVVYHSIMWQYLDNATRASLRDLLDRAGATTTPQTPLAWLRLEPHPATYHPAELRLTLWDGNTEPQDELLATTSFHGGPITLTNPVVS